MKKHRATRSRRSCSVTHSPGVSLSVPNLSRRGLGLHLFDRYVRGNQVAITVNVVDARRLRPELVLLDPLRGERALSLIHI